MFGKLLIFAIGVVLIVLWIVRSLKKEKEDGKEPETKPKVKRAKLGKIDAGDIGQIIEARDSVVGKWQIVKLMGLYAHLKKGRYECEQPDGTWKHFRYVRRCKKA